VSATSTSSRACHRRNDCRLCGSKDLELVFKLAPTPPANAFVKPSEAKKPQEKFPLDLFFCRGCGHLQLLEVVDPAILFEHYVYVSGTSPVFVRHFQDYAADLISRFGLKKGGLVVDIGSNDGTLLGFFQNAGMKALGVDPAREISEAANKAGIETLNAFFTLELAAKIRKERGPAAAVTANNVFAHADDLKGVLQGVHALLADDGVFACEVSYLAEMIRGTLFDMIYHEHVAYHTVGPLKRFLEANGFELLEAIKVETHGGSLRVIAQKKGGPRRAGRSVAERLSEEEALGLSKPEAFKAFARQIEQRKAELSGLLKKLKSEGKTIAGFGAPAKATTLMHHFGLGKDVLDFIVDDSPWKQGLLSPGLHIPVVSKEEMYKRKPDYVLILAWNFAEPIMKKHKDFLDAGGHFIVPLPTVEVI
jgi:SAM-dependent methyltransferase